MIRACSRAGAPSSAFGTCSISALYLRLAVALSFFGVTAAHAQIDRPTADEVIKRIKRNAGVPWRESTVDTFKAGDPGTRVTGIAVTMMATLGAVAARVRDRLGARAV